MAWLESQHTLARPKNWSQLLLAPDSPTGLEVCAMRIHCRFGSLPIGLLWYWASGSIRRTSTELQSVIAGVFKIKGASSWAITRAEKLQVSVFLPNELSMNDWYAGVYALPTVWPDVSMMEINNLRRVVGYDFHHIRKKYDVLSMWAMFAHVGDYCSSTLKPRGPDGTRLQKERSESLTTDLISLGMIWRTNFGLITIPMLGAPCVLRRTNYGSFVNQLLPWSFLVSKECLLACMPRFERKNKLYRCSLLVVSKMYQIAGKRSGSKSMMVLL